MTREQQLKELALELKGVRELLESERTQHREQLSRVMRANTEHAVSGAAMASRLAVGDPDAQRTLVDSVKALWDPRAVMDRIFRGLDAPLPCGHPLDCLPDHEPEDAENIRCGWCVDLIRAEAGASVVEALRAWFASDEWDDGEETEAMREAMDAYDALTGRTS